MRHPLFVEVYLLSPLTSLPPPISLDLCILMLGWLCSLSCPDGLALVPAFLYVLLALTTSLPPLITSFSYILVRAFSYLLAYVDPLS